jgi:hypothetical protein
MRTSNDPNIETLATLAAQARFANLTPAAAVRSALALWLECQTVLEEHGEKPSAAQPAHEPAQPQKPKQWPIQLHQFYSLVVKGRDEGASEKRLMKFLPDHLRTALALRDKSIQERTKEAKNRIADWRANGFTEPHWDWLAPAFWHWWNTVGRLEGKRRGGKSRAAKHGKK